MRALILFSLLTSVSFSYSQSIQKQVIGSLGGISSGGNYEVDCTVGEAVIDTFSSGSILLYQGFHHVNDTSRNTSIDKITAFKIDFLLYPNPTRDNATLKFTGGNFSTQLKVQVYTIAGKLVSTKEVEVGKSTTTTNIDVGNQSAGVYFVRITDSESNFSKSLRLVKQ